MFASDSRPLALTMGEPAGVGGEISLRAWREAREVLPPFYLLDDPDRLKRLGLGPLRVIHDPEETHDVFPSALPVLPLGVSVMSEPGCPSPHTAYAVTLSISKAVAHVMQGKARACVTNPIDKSVLYQSGFHYPGHTEYLAFLAGGGCPVMMMVCPSLRVVPVTRHIPLHEVSSSLTIDLLVRTAQITAQALRTGYGIVRPRLAFAGVNPHAGEKGHIGTEENTLLEPALSILRSQGLVCTGPHSADTLFHEEAREGYDVALCMYHDQALIPLKTLGFYDGVNITLGLSILRTSPDHGTALSLAGTGKARAESLIEALRQAHTMTAL